MPPEKYEQEPYRDVSDESGALRVHAVQPWTHVHGPHSSFSLWLQGCLKHCPGCINPAMHPLNGAPFLLSPDDIVEDILARQGTVISAKNLTIQGGEPMIQARNLTKVLELLTEQLPALTVTLFTGYLYRNLKEMAKTHAAIGTVLSHCDVVIDGPFEDSQMDSHRSVGSVNQVIYPLTEKLDPEQFVRRAQETSFYSQAGTTVSTGIRLKSNNNE